MANRLRGMGQEKYKKGFELTLHPEALDEPKSIKKPTMFFVCSMGDLFHKDVPFGFINKVMAVIDETPWHTYQILTKRTDRMADYFRLERDVPKNAWIGTTVENNVVKWRIDVLRDIGRYNEDKHEVIRFLSCEPLIDDLGEMDLSGISWVIAGGESGSQARPMRKEWVKHVLINCKNQDVPFFFKQWGTYGEDGIRRSKYSNGNLIDGWKYEEYPNTITNQ